MINHFLRGLWDGDGWISQHITGLVSTRSVVDHIIQMVRDKLDIYAYAANLNDKGTANLQVSGRLQGNKFLDWIYKDATVYLNRKHQRYLYRQYKPSEPNPIPWVSFQSPKQQRATANRTY